LIAVLKRKARASHLKLTPMGIYVQS
mgnify:CR=1